MLFGYGVLDSGYLPRWILLRLPVNAQLKAHADAALAQGVFGVPSFEVNGKVFWGLDALHMLRSYLQGDDWFSEAQWNAAQDTPTGVALRQP